MTKIEQAVSLTRHVLDSYDLEEWSIKVTNRRKSLATTDHGEKTLELSKRFILLATAKEFGGILHHEVAHMLLGPGKGHGKEFQEMCGRIGIKDSFACSNYPIYTQRYKYVCENCGVLGSSEKRQELICATCVHERKELVPIKVSINRVVANAW